MAVALCAAQQAVSNASQGGAAQAPGRGLEHESLFAPAGLAGCGRLLGSALQADLRVHGLGGAASFGSITSRFEIPRVAQKRAHLVLRVRVEFLALHSPVRLPINYNYHLTSLIYGLLERSSRDYSAFLHDEGYRFGARRFKLFTYSQLRFERFQLEPPEIVSLGRSIEWQISSPVGEFVEHLAQGLLSQGQVELAGVALQIERIETLAPPEFSERMKFICLSPLVVSRAVEHNGKLTAHYHRHDEADLADAVRANLLKKYELIHGETLASSELAITFDESYIRKRGGQVYKLIDFKGTKIKGIFCPFVVEGSRELIEVGYEAGFGEKNSMGFGMVEVVKSQGVLSKGLSGC